MLHSLTFVPKFWNLEDLLYLENDLKDLGMNMETLQNFSQEEVIIHLQQLHFDWNHFEIFADFLMSISKESQFDFTEKAIAIYDYVQKESKVFSFGIFNKLSSLRQNG
jgi:hypothetical protein